MRDFIVSGLLPRLTRFRSLVSISPGSSILRGADGCVEEGSDLNERVLDGGLMGLEGRLDPKGRLLGGG